MKNAILHDFSPIVTRSDRGELAENMLYGLLRHHFDREQIQYWMNKDQKEVDFIINKKSAIEEFQADLNNGFFSNLLDAPDWTFQEIDEDELEHYIRTP